MDTQQGFRGLLGDTCGTLQAVSSSNQILKSKFYSLLCSFIHQLSISVCADRLRGDAHLQEKEETAKTERRVDDEVSLKETLALMPLTGMML